MWATALTATAVTAGNAGGMPGAVAGGGVAGVEFVRVDSGMPRLMVFKLYVTNNKQVRDLRSCQ
jgi:hypothetical protein